MKGFGNIMKEAQKLQAQMEQLQAEAGNKKVEATAGGGGASESGGRARNHPAVQAALNVFQGEVVAVRPRAPEEGESS